MSIRVHIKAPTGSGLHAAIGELAAKEANGRQLVFVAPTGELRQQWATHFPFAETTTPRLFHRTYSGVSKDLLVIVEEAAYPPFLSLIEDLLASCKHEIWLINPSLELHGMPTKAFTVVGGRALSTGGLVLSQPPTKGPSIAELIDRGYLRQVSRPEPNPQLEAYAAGFAEARRKHPLALQGERFGYPDCCIAAFLANTHRGDRSRKLCGTGYVPCAACNARYTEQELVDHIKARRDPSLPAFPDPGPGEPNRVEFAPGTFEVRRKLNTDYEIHALPQFDAARLAALQDWAKQWRPKAVFAPEVEAQQTLTNWAWDQGLLTRDELRARTGVPDTIGINSRGQVFVSDFHYARKPLVVEWPEASGWPTPVKPPMPLAATAEQRVADKYPRVRT